MKHRTITGFVTVTLLAVAVSAAAMRSHLPWTDGIVASGTALLKGNANKFRTVNFEEPLVRAARFTPDDGNG